MEQDHRTYTKDDFPHNKKHLPTTSPPAYSLKRSEFVFVIGSPPRSTTLCQRLKAAGSKIEHINLIDELDEIVNRPNSSFAKYYRDACNFTAQEIQYIRSLVARDRDPNLQAAYLVLVSNTLIVKYLFVRIPRALDSQAKKTYNIVEGFPYARGIWDRFVTTMEPQGWKPSSEMVAVNMRRDMQAFEDVFKHESGKWVDVKDKTTDDDIFDEVYREVKELGGWKGVQGGTDDANEEKDEELEEERLDDEVGS